MLGTEDSEHYVRQAGGNVVPLSYGQEAEVVVVSDEEGFDFMEGMNIALSSLIVGTDAEESAASAGPVPIRTLFSR